MSRIQWKIILLCLIVTFIPIVMLNQHSIESFDRFTRVSLEDHMKDSGLVVGELYKRSLNEGGRLSESSASQLQRTLSRYADEIDSHIQILSTQGVVMIDSHMAVATASDLSGRREVKEALAGRYSARSLLQRDRQRMYYYTARSIKDEKGRVIAVSYIYRHTGPIVAAIREMIQHQRMVTGVACGIAACLAVVLAYTLTSRLRRLTAGATAFEKGMRILMFRCPVGMRSLSWELPLSRWPQKSGVETDITKNSFRQSPMS